MIWFALFIIVFAVGMAYIGGAVIHDLEQLRDIKRNRRRR